MIPELSAWNGGHEIKLESWIECVGSFKQAVGYATIFWPQFVLFEDYILRESFNMESLRGFEKQCTSRAGVEWVMNHLHITDIHCNDFKSVSEDKILFLGNVLKEIYQAKLASQFPDRPCMVEFHEPEQRTQLIDFQLSFWQKKHEEKV